MKQAQENITKMRINVLNNLGKPFFHNMFLENPKKR